MNGKDLAAHLEEVQQLAFQRGLDGGREEACRMAQASLLPHLKSVVEGFNALIVHVRLAEAHTSSQAVSLALAIVEQVVGAPAGSYRFDELQSALSQAIALANRNEIHMNQDDLEYLNDLMENYQLVWPNHPCVAIQGNPACDRGHFEMVAQSDQRETLDQHVAQHISTLLSAKTHSTP